MNYYLRIKGKPFGPFDENRLVDMKAKGKIFKNTELSSDRVNWFPAETLNFLFSSPPPVPEAAQQPTTTGYVVSSEPAIWFYSTDGSTGYGPITQNAVVQMIQNGTLKFNSFIWQEGGTAQVIKTVSVFASYFGGQVSPENEQGQNNIQSPQTDAFDFGKMLFPISGTSANKVFGNESLWIVMMLGALPLLLTSINHQLYGFYGVLLYFSLFWGWIFKSTLFYDIKKWYYGFGAALFTGIVGLFVYFVLLVGLAQNGFDQLLNLPEHNEPLIRLFGFITITGLSEELCKIVPPAFYLMLKGRDVNPKMLLLIAVFSGLGFAVIENKRYSVFFIETFLDSLKNSSSEQEAGLALIFGPIMMMTQILVRSLSCCFLHAVWCGIFAYQLWYGVRTNAVILAVITGWVMSAILHGVYDWFCAMEPAIAAIIAAFSFLLFFSYVQNVNVLMKENETLSEGV
jgi:RsiW-degrading membrane proteinase PrsW (M82 family)